MSKLLPRSVRPAPVLDLRSPAAVFTSLGLIAVALAGCGEAASDEDTDTMGVSTGPTLQEPTGMMPSEPAQPAAPAGACISSELDEDGNMLLLAQPANNYAFSSQIEVGVTAVAPNTELFFDWSGLTEDFLGHPVDPLADIDTFALILWRLPHAEMQQKLNADELGASDSAAAIAIYTENMRTSGSIFDFTVVGGGELPREELMARLDPEQYDPATHSYTLMPMTGGNLGQGVKMVQAFTLDPASTNTNVAVTPDSTTLTYEANLTDLVPVQIPAGQNNILVDWSEMQTNALGREFVERSIYEVMVAKYVQSPAELEGQFLDLELIAEQMYRGDVPAGDDLALTDLVDESGQAFPGIDGDGTWVLALVCGPCGNPAPWYLTVLEPCAP